MHITQQERHRIKADLVSFCEHKGSQNKAAKSLDGVSSATISQIINDNWDLINDSMWFKISAQIRSKTKHWDYVDTTDAIGLRNLFTDAKENSLVFAVVGSEGTGKTEAARRFARANKNVFHLSCNEYWDRRWFLKELLKSMGKDPAGMVMPEMMQEAVMTLKSMDSPQIIFDEADKLKDQVLLFFITLCNELEDICSMVLMATQHLKKRIQKGLTLNKRGYREIYSRMGKRFIELHGLSYMDVTKICLANGIDDTKKIKAIWEDCDADVRRVKRIIHETKRLAA